MTAEQLQRLRQAMENHRRPPRTQGARVREAIQHAKTKPAASGKANGPDNVFKAQSQYGTKPD